MFDAVVAKRYGTDEAIFIHAMYWWLSLNKANDKHHYDGRYWTYNSMDAMTELFPFWSVKQIRRIIKSLTDKGVLLVGNYNRVRFDRTQWYSLSDELMTYYETGRFSDVEVSAPSESAETDPVPSAQIGTRDAQTGTFDLPKRANEKCPNGQMRSAQTGRPIPVIYTVNNTVNNNPLTP
jgi:hypothetical protein